MKQSLTGALLAFACLSATTGAAINVADAKPKRALDAAHATPHNMAGHRRARATGYAKSHSRGGRRTYRVAARPAATQPDFFGAESTDGRFTNFRDQSIAVERGVAPRRAYAVATSRAPRRSFGVERIRSTRRANTVERSRERAVETSRAPSREVAASSGVVGGKPSGCPHSWCGCWLAQSMGLNDRSLWLARNWTKFPRVSGPAPGVVAVWRNHVGQVTAVPGPGRVLKSGNDARAVRERERSSRGGVIAWVRVS